jgi:hypothetical protein
LFAPVHPHVSAVPSWSESTVTVPAPQQLPAVHTLFAVYVPSVMSVSQALPLLQLAQPLCKTEPS